MQPPFPIPSATLISAFCVTSTTTCDLCHAIRMHTPVKTFRTHWPAAADMLQPLPARSTNQQSISMMNTNFERRHLQFVSRWHCAQARCKGCAHVPSACRMNLHRNTSSCSSISDSTAPAAAEHSNLKIALSTAETRMPLQHPPIPCLGLALGARAHESKVRPSKQHLQHTNSCVCGDDVASVGSTEYSEVSKLVAYWGMGSAAAAVNLRHGEPRTRGRIAPAVCRYGAGIPDSG